MTKNFLFFCHFRTCVWWQHRTLLRGMPSHLTHLYLSTWNSRGIANKRFVNTNNIDMLLATGTKLAPHIHFSIPGYTIIRADHPSNRRRGASAILIKNNIRHDALPGIIEEEVQVACINLYLNSINYRIGSLYSAPCYREGLLPSIFH